MARPTKNAWGRPIAECPRPQEISEAAPTTNAWGRPLPTRTPTIADFREVGLSEADAKTAAKGLAEGRYLSFEDACLSTTIFGPSKAVQLDESLMRSKAREFARTGVEVAE